MPIHVLARQIAGRRESPSPSLTAFSSALFNVERAHSRSASVDSGSARISRATLLPLALSSLLCSVRVLWPTDRNRLAAQVINMSDQLFFHPVSFSLFNTR